MSGPVNGDDEYNGETYDARLETPGWNAPGFATDTQQWLPVKVTTKTNKLQHTVLAAAAFPAIEKIHTFVAHTITEPSPGRCRYNCFTCRFVVRFTRPKTPNN